MPMSILIAVALVASQMCAGQKMPPNPENPALRMSSTKITLQDKIFEVANSHNTSGDQDITSQAIYTVKNVGKSALKSVGLIAPKAKPGFDTLVEIAKSSSETNWLVVDFRSGGKLLGQAWYLDTYPVFRAVQMRLNQNIQTNREIQFDSAFKSTRLLDSNVLNSGPEAFTQFKSVINQLSIRAECKFTLVLRYSTGQSGSNIISENEDLVCIYNVSLTKNVDKEKCAPSFTFTRIASSKPDSTFFKETKLFDSRIKYASVTLDETNLLNLAVIRPISDKIGSNLNPIKVTVGQSQ